MKWASLLAFAFVAIGCRDAALVPPRSLDSPSAMAVARGKVCLTTFEDLERVVQYEIAPCAEGERGAIALITNEQSDRLALMDLTSPLPRLVDLDPATPGPNHLEVGRLPVDVAASPDGTVAYTLNQLDRDVSIVDLYSPKVLSARFSVDETPIAMDVEPVTGEVIVAAGSPTRLYGFAGISFCGADELCDDSPSPDEVAPRTIDLPGTVSGLTMNPLGDEAWVVYRDLAYASVISFGVTPDGFDTPCLSGTDSKPCVVAHVSLVFDCADGLDNDGDGLVDQQDSQCFGPRGAESPAGIGRMYVDACANGLDDDEDGLTDRDDPECMFASGVDEAVAPFEEPPPAVCIDGVDNDDDGNIDYPDDPACYGPAGRAEVIVEPRGFDAVGIDTHGVFAYVADRASEQILVIDARRKRLIDAPASELPPSDAFDPGLGVDIAPSPLSVQGVIDRTVTWVDPNDSEHVILRYDFGAWTSANNGSIQYVDTVVSFCELTGEVVDANAFWRGEQSDAETLCLQLPEFPLAEASARVVATDETLPAECLESAPGFCSLPNKDTEEDPCTDGEVDGDGDCYVSCTDDSDCDDDQSCLDFFDCATCLEAGEEAICEACELYEPTKFEVCQRTHRTEVLQYVNPRFALRDIGPRGDDGRLLGSGTCVQPDELTTRMQAYAQDNPTKPQDLKCNSLLMPQPLQPEALTLAVDETLELSALGRADLFELRTLQFDLENGKAQLVGTRAADQRILTEGVTTTFEGIIPNTQRADGLLATDAEEDGSIWVDVGFNPCSRGVVAGDRFVITGAPLDGCAVSEDLEYEVVEVTDSELRIAPYEGGTDEVPTRECFDIGFAYELRSNDEWLVVGEVGGFLSPFESSLGRCVPRFGAERITSRVRSGELYVGPYFSFYLYPGIAGLDEIAPTRDTSVTFQVSSGFSSQAFPTCSSLGQQCAAGLFPTEVLWVPGLPNGTLLLSPDPNDEFIHVRNLDDAAGGYTVVR